MKHIDPLYIVKAVEMLDDGTYEELSKNVLDHIADCQVCKKEIMALVDLVGDVKMCLAVDWLKKDAKLYADWNSQED